MTLTETDIEALLPTIYAHANEAIPREACGVILSTGEQWEYRRCRNVAADTDQFEIDAQDLAAAEDAGEVACIVHSHPYVSPEPSQADLVCCNAGTLPWLIVNAPVGGYRYLQPDASFTLPLLGRRWAYGVLDCYSLVRDYYRQELGLTLNDYPRNGHWWERGESVFVDHFAAEGFVRVYETPRAHDVLLMQIEADVPNHVGVMLPGTGSKFLHHLLDHLSCDQVYGGYWEKHTIMVLRHGGAQR
jgi:proteasome lid subunit RPN8/RPN11